MDQLPASYLDNTARSDYAYTSYFVELPGNVQFGHVFAPRFWSHVARRLKKNDLIRLRANDDSFDFMVAVVEVKPSGGVLVEAWPKIPRAASEAEAVGVQPFEKNGQWHPRIDYQKATKWRVIGLDNNEYAAGFADKRAAATAMIKYMAEMGMTPETTVEHLATLGLSALMD